MADALFEHSRPGFALAVYANRIEVRSGTVFKKSEVIPLRNVTNVEITKLRKLKVTTNDGKTHEFVVGMGVEDAREAILEGL